MACHITIQVAVTVGKVLILTLALEPTKTKFSREGMLIFRQVAAWEAVLSTSVPMPMRLSDKVTRR